MRLPRLVSYHRPGRLEEATRLLDSPGSHVMGGGTRLVASHDPTIRILIDLGRLGLEECRFDLDEVSIGAGVRVQRLVREAHPLGTAAHRTSFSRARRNQATVVGEAIAAGDNGFLAALLVAAGATLELAGGASIPLARFHRERPRGIVTRIHWTRPARWGLEELSVTPTATPLVAVAGAVAKDGSTRVAVFGGVEFPVLVESGDPDAVAAAYAPPDRPWATRGYSIEMARVLTRRLMEGLSA